MATRSQQQQAPSTYNTKRFSFIGNPQSRGYAGDRDQRFLNWMPEIVTSPLSEGKKFYIKPRPSLVSLYDFKSGESRGIYRWNGNQYYVFGNTLYKNNGALYTLSTSTGRVGFTEFIDDVGTVTLIMVDGINGYIITTADAVTQISTAVTPDATWSASATYTEGQIIAPTTPTGFYYKVTVAGTSDVVEPTWPTVEGDTVMDNDVTYVTVSTVNAFPTPHVPFPVFMDGYLFLAKAGTADIYNSNLNNPDDWTAGEYVSAEMYPDTIQALTRNNNYVCAVGQYTMEYFYDAANATGSPLARNESAIQQFGTVAPNSVVSTGDSVCLVGSGREGNKTVYVVDGFKAKEIAIPAVKQTLAGPDVWAAQTSIYGNIIRAGAQKLLIISMPTRTWVYSFDTQMWHEWSFEGPIGQILWGSQDFDAEPIIQTTLGQVCVVRDYQSYDNIAGVNYLLQCLVVTSKVDFDSLDWKYLSRISLIGESVTDGPSGVYLNVAIGVSWSDDDYQTWSPYRNINLNQIQQFVHQLGRTRRRAFRFLLATPGAFTRLEGFEVDYNVGSK